MFSLHPQLAADTIPLGDLTLSRVLLMNSSELPWLILVPRRENVNEWHQLKPQDQQQLHTESMSIGSLLMDLFNGDKLNTGALGNVVPQLHIHHVVRYKHDSVWPNPVWGNIEHRSYNDTKRAEIINKLKPGIIQKLGRLSEC